MASPNATAPEIVIDTVESSELLPELNGTSSSLDQKVESSLAEPDTMPTLAINESTLNTLESFDEGEEEDISDENAVNDGDEGTFGEEEEEESFVYDPFPELSNEQLEAMVAKKMAKNERMDRENFIFQRYWKRLEQEQEESHPASAKSIKTKTSKTQNASRQRRRSMKRFGTGSDSEGEGSEPVTVVLTDLQKAEIARREVEQIATEFESKQAAANKLISDLRAVLYDCQERLNELPILMDGYQLEVVDSAKDSRSGKVEVETLERFYQRHVHANEVLIDKLQLKTMTLTQQRHRLAEQLKQKTESGSILHRVDFDQIRIENTRNAQSLDERNSRLMECKVQLGKAHKLLTNRKTKLHAVEQELERLKEDLNRRASLMAKVEAEYQEQHRKTKHAKAKHVKLKQEKEDYKLPSVLEYVESQAAMPKLRAQVKTMERKVNLAQVGCCTLQPASLFDRPLRRFDTSLHQPCVSLTRFVDVCLQLELKAAQRNAFGNSTRMRMTDLSS
eukprot:TRINITY_DN10955_c1_g1_i1.p2 TRINITY_DN10955_c1_g1~~TRINITY_DN10955_c1_g1_i1.p2  ORF type:complete len:506 (+),score=129.20 TRINITY_DN10955_c1_g1_i1:1900-3417(+)